jgi:hypothetical protein
MASFELTTDLNVAFNKPSWRRRACLCRGTIHDIERLSHSVEVTASSLCEAGPGARNHPR